MFTFFYIYDRIKENKRENGARQMADKKKYNYIDPMYEVNNLENKKATRPRASANAKTTTSKPINDTKAKAEKEERKSNKDFYLLFRKAHSIAIQRAIESENYALSKELSALTISSAAANKKEPIVIESIQSEPLLVLKPRKKHRPHIRPRINKDKVVTMDIDGAVSEDAKNALLSAVSHEEARSKRLTEKFVAERNAKDTEAIALKKARKIANATLSLLYKKLSEANSMEAEIRIRQKIEEVEIGILFKERQYKSIVERRNK